MDLERRANLHAALGDAGRLRLVELLSWGDRTVRELAAESGMPGNLLAHHLNVLEGASVIERRVSEGDHRRKYVTIRRDNLRGMVAMSPAAPKGSILFVCSHNSARSQYAASRWRARTGGPADSAGNQPAMRVHPTAIRVASEAGVDLSKAAPRGYESIEVAPDLVVSVCDRAREAKPPFDAVMVHWSIPDPVAVRSVAAFRSAFAEIDDRIQWLAGAR